MSNHVTIKKVHIQGYRKFKDFVFKPTDRMNIIVGCNEAGKSTLLEAIIMTLTGRINGVPVADALNPYWFNKELVRAYFNSDKANDKLPEFQIDVYLETNIPALNKLRGVNNLAKEESVGLSLWAHPNEEYLTDLRSHLQKDNVNPVLPIEYYVIEWLGFSGEFVTRRPKGLGYKVIDSHTTQSNRVIDYYTRQTIQNLLEPKESIPLAAEYRQQLANTGRNLLQDLNDKLREDSAHLLGDPIQLTVDQSRATSWENTLIPTLDDMPLSMAGLGSQVRSKTVLALNHDTEASSFIFIEEPENHLSHTRLRELISYIQSKTENRQIFITTHSSYVMNRLGLDQIVLLGDEAPKRLTDLSEDTVSFFRRLSGFDTLRLVLADTMVLVEGPSDEILFNRFFKDISGHEPANRGVDVMAIQGVSFKRYFELAKALDRQLFALRDNDGNSPEDWRKKLENYLEDDKRAIFVGQPTDGETLEPQLCSLEDNQEPLARILGVENENVCQHMTKNKTESALLIAEAKENLTPPQYISAAIEAVMQTCQRTH